MIIIAPGRKGYMSPAIAARGYLLKGKNASGIALLAGLAYRWHIVRIPVHMG